MRSTGEFRVTSWNEETVTEWEGGSRLTRAEIVQAFTGALEATGDATLFMYYRDDGTASIAGFQCFDGRLGEHTGRFVARFVGAYDGADATASLTVVPGSGTGGFDGLAGEGTSVAGHEPPGSYEFDFEI